jgi:hypothetical protein
MDIDGAINLILNRQEPEIDAKLVEGLVGDFASKVSDAGKKVLAGLKSALEQGKTKIKDIVTAIQDTDLKDFILEIANKSGKRVDTLGAAVVVLGANTIINALLELSKKVMGESTMATSEEFLKVKDVFNVDRDKLVGKSVGKCPICDKGKMVYTNKGADYYAKCDKCSYMSGVNFVEKMPITDRKVSPRQAALLDAAISECNFQRRAHNIMNVLLENVSDVLTESSLVIKKGDEFYTGSGWSKEFPDAQGYPKLAEARKVARKLGEGVKIMQDYGLSTESSIPVWPVGTKYTTDEAKKLLSERNWSAKVEGFKTLLDSVEVQLEKEELDASDVAEMLITHLKTCGVKEIEQWANDNPVDHIASQDEENLDEWLNDLYDFADSNNIWIG